METKSRRMLMYTHNSFGLGHIRRVQKIASYLVGKIPSLSIIIITGSPHLSLLSSLQGIDYIKLPSLAAQYVDNQKTGYRSSTLSVNFETILELRRSLILATAQKFKPHIFFSDMGPTGLGGETQETLNWLRSHAPHTKTVVGFRDIIDEPATVVERWREHNGHQQLAQYYDRVFVYGMKDVFDFISAYKFDPPLARKTVYCGYLLDHSSFYKSKSNQTTSTRDDRYKSVLLGLVGGGAAGTAVLDRLLECSESLTDIKFVLVLGPLMPPSDRRAFKSRYCNAPNVVIKDTVTPTELSGLAEDADLILSMAGYNSICETIITGKKMIVIPLTAKHQEQMIRASRLAALGLFKMIHLEELTVDSLYTEITSLESSADLPKEARMILASQGLENVTKEIWSLLYPENQITHV